MSFALNHKIMQYYVRVSIQIGVSDSNPLAAPLEYIIYGSLKYSQQSLRNQVTEN